ncbi:probable BOI-related E3 ubiquitin-protein ligase 2 [Neltuma alba]|uniref:probable BOI-related E3 ubiquitin-protein ligase 2 n=1 Tax=Neltuma alba TaxID=207710 RepID=UPI0010A45E54|nr:probable BOI-related E3 ubiquitin-protein ligase 2 [Prosopis alba]
MARSNQLQSFRNLQTFDGQMSRPVAYYNPAQMQDRSHPQHPPYVPPFHVAGFAPGPVPAADGSDGGADVQWNYDLEPERKRLKEQDFLENNSQISSVDFLQPPSVSTGLGLSFDNARLASTGDSALLSLVGDDIDQELQQQDVEIDRFLKVQGEQMRQSILEKVEATQLESISIVEGKVLDKIREGEAKVEVMNKRNKELEERTEQLRFEVGAWQQRSKYNENMVASLKYSLQQVQLQSRDGKEGCGDSEVDDTASYCHGGSIDFQLLSKDNNEMMKCKACRVNEVSMLLLPCKHLCLCKDCESRLSFCPLCQSSKFMGMEVYM